jgi:hypothetical protein
MALGIFSGCLFERTRLLHSTGFTQWSHQASRRASEDFRQATRHWAHLRAIHRFPLTNVPPLPSKVCKSESAPGFSPWSRFTFIPKNNDGLDALSRPSRLTVDIGRNASRCRECPSIFTHAPKPRLLTASPVRPASLGDSFVAPSEKCHLAHRVEGCIAT